jgi:hypothetical protein
MAQNPKLVVIVTARSEFARNACFRRAWERPDGRAADRL